MKILHISCSYKEQSEHAFSFHIKKAFESLGHEVKSIHPYDFIPKRLDYRFGEYFKDYYIGKRIFPISRITHEYPNFDIVFIENPKFSFDNDVEMPVIYYHRDLKCNCYVRNADFFLYRFKGAIRKNLPISGQLELVKLYYPEIYWNEDVKKLFFVHAVSPEEFNEYDSIRKDIFGITYMGSYKSVKIMINFNSIHRAIYLHHVEIMDFIYEHEIAEYFQEVSGGIEDYRDVLARSEAIFIIPAWNSWSTRRLFEASLYRTIPVIFIQNKDAKKVFNELGYIHNETCIMFEHKEELLDLDIYEYDVEAIQDAGFKMVMERHTYKARAQELLNKINISSILLKGVLRKLIKQDNLSFKHIINELGLNGEIKDYTLEKAMEMLIKYGK